MKLRYRSRVLMEYENMFWVRCLPVWEMLLRSKLEWYYLEGGLVVHLKLEHGHINIEEYLSRR